MVRLEAGGGIDTTVRHRNAKVMLGRTSAVDYLFGPGGRMGDVRLRPVTYAELSALRHEVAVSEGLKFSAPDFLVVSYFGVYRSGSPGEEDALYIVAAAAAALKAWWSPCTVIDFRELEYRWGDNMEWVTSITWNPVLRTNEPFAIVVGDRCRDSLRSLLQEEYEQYCVETLEKAFESCRRQLLEYDQKLKAFRGRAEPDAAADGGSK